MHTPMKLDSKQPWGVWAFVIGLNVVGVIGYFILQSKGITLQSIHAGQRTTGSETSGGRKLIDAAVHPY